MKTFGFSVNNDAFEKNSWYFRNALVRANYNNLQKGIHSTTKFLGMFFSNLLLDTNYELKNRYLHIDFESAVQSDKKDNPKCQNVTLEELAILNAIKNDPKITQKELAAIIGKSDRTVKRYMDTMKEKGIIRRKNGKRNGEWDVLEGQFFEDFRTFPDMEAAREAGCDLSEEELIRQRRWTHVIAPIDLSKGTATGWRIYRSYDFGYGKPFSCAWWAVDYDDVAYRILELYGCTDTPNEGLKWTPAQQFAKIAEIEREHPWLKGKSIQGVADPAIWDASRGESVAETAVKYGIYFTPGDNNRVNGWMQMHYRMQFDENGYARLYVFSNCKAFIRTIPLMMYDKYRNEDLDTNLEDHAADEARYFCMSRPVKAIRPVETQETIFDPLNQIKNRRQ